MEERFETDSFPGRGGAFHFPVVELVLGALFLGAPALILYLVFFRQGR